MSNPELFFLQVQNSSSISSTPNISTNTSNSTTTTNSSWLFQGFSAVSANQNPTNSTFSSASTNTAPDYSYLSSIISSTENKSTEELDSYNLNSVLAALDDDNDVGLNDTLPIMGTNTTAESAKISGFRTLADIEKSFQTQSATNTNTNTNTTLAAVPDQQPQQPVQLPTQSPQLTSVNSVSSTTTTGASAPSSTVYIPLPSAQHQYMTKAEQALVIKLQLSQLQNTSDTSITNSFIADDFYNQVYTARRGGRINPNSNIIPTNVFHNNNQASKINADGSVKLSAANLGRIQTSNLRKPKKLMELSDNSVSSNNPNSNIIPDPDLAPPRRYMFSSTSISYLIEEGCRTLMDLEDCDSAIIAIQNQISYNESQHIIEDPNRLYERSKLQQQREYCVLRLLESLDIAEIQLHTLFNPMNQENYGQHLLFKLASVHKGRVLIFRSLLLLNPPHTAIIIAILLKDLKQLIHFTTNSNNFNIHNSIDDRLFTRIADLFYSFPLQILNQMFQIMLSNVTNDKTNNTVLPLIIRNKLGCMLLQVICRVGHDQQQTLNNITIQQQQQQQNNPMNINQINPDILALRSLLTEWRYHYDELISTMIKLKLFSKLLIDLPRPGIEPITIANNPSNYASNPAMFELLAALISHARKEQRDEIQSELAPVLESELKFLYGTKLDIQPPVITSNTIDPPEVLPPLTAPLKFLTSVFLNENDNNSTIFKVNKSIQNSQQAIQTYLQFQAQKKPIQSFAQIAANSGTANSYANTTINTTVNNATTNVTAHSAQHHSHNIGSSSSNNSNNNNNNSGHGNKRPMSHGNKTQYVPKNSNNNSNSNNPNTNNSNQNPPKSSPQGPRGYAAAALAGASTKTEQKTNIAASPAK